MDRVGTGLRRHFEDLRDVEVRIGRGPPAEGVRFVGHRHMQPIQVRLGVDGDAGQIRIATGTGDADRDLAAVSDEDFAHGTPPLG